MDNLYEQPEPETSPHEDEGMEGEDSMHGEGGALIDKSIFPDAKPGDHLTVRVSRVLEKELEVMPEESGDDEHGSEMAEPQPAMGGSGMMD